MAQKQTRLYYNTGFNVGNTPGYTSILNGASYTDFESHWDYQDYFLTSLKLKATWDQVKNADYLKFGSAYYWITGVSMINENNAELFLELDALASLNGIRSINFVEGEGVITRAHPLNDAEFSNLLPEPIGKQGHLDCPGPQVFGPNNEGHTPGIIYMSTLGLTNEIQVDANGIITPVNATATVYEAIGQQVGEVVVPNTPKSATGCRIGLIQSPIDYYLTYDDHGAEDINNQIAYLRSLGLEQSVVGCYTVPYGYLKNGYHFENASKHKLDQISNTYAGESDFTAYDYKRWDSSNFHWNKTQLIDNYYCLVSRLTGELKNYKCYDIANYTTGEIIFRIGVDRNVNGKPYCWPIYYDGASLASLIGANGISGMEWLNIPVVVGGASGSLWVKNDYIRNTAELGTIGALGVLGQGMDLASSANAGVGEKVTPSQTPSPIAESELEPYSEPRGYGLKAGLGIIQSSAKLMYSAGKLDTDFARDTGFAVPGVTGNNLTGLQTSVENDFILYHYTLTKQDYERIDKFFDNFGYTQNCVFDSSYCDLNPNGQGFCYLKATGVKISRNIGSIALRSKAEQAIQNGIRIWHQLPN